MASRLIEDGGDDRMVADALQQKTLTMARHYSQGANLKMKMKDVTERINISEKKRRDLSNFPESVKPIA